MNCGSKRKKSWHSRRSRRLQVQKPPVVVFKVDKVGGFNVPNGKCLRPSMVFLETWGLWARLTSGDECRGGWRRIACEARDFEKVLNKSAAYGKYGEAVFVAAIRVAFLARRLKFALSLFHLFGKLVKAGQIACVEIQTAFTGENVKSGLDGVFSSPHPLVSTL